MPAVVFVGGKQGRLFTVCTPARGKRFEALVSKLLEVEGEGDEDVARDGDEDAGERGGREAGVAIDHGGHRPDKVTSIALFPNASTPFSPPSSCLPCLLSCFSRQQPTRCRWWRWRLKERHQEQVGESSLPTAVLRTHNALQRLYTVDNERSIAHVDEFELQSGEDAPMSMAADTEETIR